KSIAEDLLTDETHVTFTLTSYFIGIAVGQLAYGPIVDKYGRKKPLIAGLTIYILAALGCALSYNIDMMILMRLLQGLGGCVGMVADRKSTRLNSSHVKISYAVFCLKKKKTE